MEVKVLHLIAFCGFVGLILGQTRTRPEDCDPCDPGRCDKESVLKCTAGTVADRCGCCQICARSEYELCDHPEIKNPKGQYGKCGDHLECRLRDDLTESEEQEALCFCTDETSVCGSDGKTYENKCQLKAASINGVTLQKEGPCSNAPVIVSKPQNIRNKTGANIFLACEAKGFPIPSISWTWTRVDGHSVHLPIDDIHISVNTRGGPEKYEVTGWLQIMDLEKKHEGDYLCVAMNDKGDDSASARVNVIEDEEHDKQHHKKRKHGNKHGKKLRHNEI